MDSNPLIDVFIVGAQKSYTTSLKSYLGGHPLLITHPQQEMTYFNDEREYGLGYKNALTHYFRGVGEHGNRKLLAKSANMYTSEVAISRLKEHNPACKLILSLRNPVDRAYSSYLMEQNYAEMDFPFEQITSIAEKADVNYWPFNLFIDAGNYVKHLKTIYKYFPKEQVKVVICANIREDAVKVCKDIFQWLDIDSAYKPEIKIHNATLKKRSKFSARLATALLKKSSAIKKYSRFIIPSYYNHKVGDFIRMANRGTQHYAQMDKATRGYLLNYYKQANKELEELTGLNVTAFWDK